MEIFSYKYLPEVDVIHSEVVALQQTRHRNRGADTHLLRRAPTHCKPLLNACVYIAVVNICLKYRSRYPSSPTSTHPLQSPVTCVDIALMNMCLKYVSVI